MKNQEEINDSSLDTKEIPEREKKYVIAGIVFLSLLIVVLLGLIAEAYINQHPALEFLQYTYFKPEMIITSSISFVILYIGILFLAIAALNQN